MNAVTKINLSRIGGCEQSWDGMPEGEKGKICQACQNTVIDFRNSTEAEIAQAHVFSDIQVCGYYNQNQLKVPKRASTNSKLLKLKSVYLSMMSLITIPALSQDNPEPVLIEQGVKDFAINERGKCEIKQSKAVQNDSLVISGQISDSMGEALPFANCWIKGTDIGASSDFDGNYRLYMNDIVESLELIILQFQYIGYEPKEIKIEKADLLSQKRINLNVNLEEGDAEHFIVGVIYVKPKLHKRIIAFPRKIWNKLRYRD